MKCLLFALSLGLLAGCTSSSPVAPVLCSLEQGLANDAAQGLMQVCTCSDQSQVAAYILAKTPASANFCAPAKGGKVKSVIGDAVCGPVLTAVLAGGCVNVPTCSGANPSGSALQSAISFCQSKL